MVFLFSSTLKKSDDSIKSARDNHTFKVFIRVKMCLNHLYNPRPMKAHSRHVLGKLSADPWVVGLSAPICDL